MPTLLPLHSTQMLGLAALCCEWPNAEHDNGGRPDTSVRCTRVRMARRPAVSDGKAKLLPSKSLKQQEHIKG